MSYRVTVPLVLARDKEGKVHERYEGAVIDWLDDDQKRHFLEAQLVERVGAPAPTEAEADDVEDGAKPPSNAAKPVLVEWVVEHALKDDGSDYTEAEADDMTKPQLWDVINSIED